VFNPSGAGFALARALYRSRDGGVTWGLPLATLDQTNGFGQFAVVGSRFVATALPSVFGARGCSDTDPLPPAQPSTVVYASDDGGKTWQPVGQSIESQHLSVDGMVLMGTTIIVRATTLFPGGCATTGNTFQPKTSLWRSSDDGRSWQQVATFSAVLNMLSFTPRADGTGYLGVGLLASPSASPASASFTVLFSSDGGTTWAPLPGLDPSRTTITAPSDVQWDTIAITPSGAVAGQVAQYPIPGGPSAIVVIRPSDPQPAWTLYAPDASTAAGAVSGITTVASGSTLWALDVTAHTLSYLPLP
jgi:BNR/Asp-box repeat